jgi:hypothetical protein
MDGTSEILRFAQDDNTLFSQRCLANGEIVE